jgi:hypothetical protein
MAAKYSNEKGISLPMAVWLARDEYQHDDRSNVISVTSLLKSTRQIVLSSRVQPQSANQLEDISNRLASRIGTSLHNSIELSWTENYEQALTDLGYPKRAIERVKINPEPEELDEDCIPIYFEQRSEKKVGNWIISGQFDIVFDGQVQDVKSTSVYTYINKTNDLKYSQQGSLYRWLNPSLITKDDMAIEFIFKDWNGNMAKSDPNYPKMPVLEYTVPLISIPQTEMFVVNKLNEIDKYMSADEADIPYCNDEQLWRRKPQYKYYSKPDAKRASKNFDNPAEANMHLASKGVGEIREVKSEPMACKYCNAFSICSQAKQFVNNGELKI